MIAVLLAAGLGTRLNPLTHYRPKPLINFQGKALISHHIENLMHLGIDHIHINTSHGVMMEEYVQKAHPAAPINITHEPYLQPLGPLQGLVNIKDTHQLTGPLLVISADIFTSLLPCMLNAPQTDGHLFLTSGPSQDFDLYQNRVIKGSLTYSNIGIFQANALQCASSLKSHILSHHFTGSILQQPWLNVGDFKTLT